MSEGNELGNLGASRSSFGTCDSGTGTTNFYGPPSIDRPNPVSS